SRASRPRSKPSAGSGAGARTSPSAGCSPSTSRLSRARVTGLRLASLQRAGGPMARRAREEETPRSQPAGKSPRRTRRLVEVMAGIAALGVVGVGALAARARAVVNGDYAHVPEPAIVADTTPEGIARGEMLFQTICMECHGGPDGRATGK